MGNPLSRPTAKPDDVDTLVTGPGEVEGSSIPRTEDADLNPLETSDHCDASIIDLRVHDFPFENIVFEGGGTKGLAYCGAIQVLEELSIIHNIRRIAGTSAGAITAAFLAVGFSSADIRVFMDEDLNSLMNDHSYGYASVLPNILRNFGWNPGNRFLGWLGSKLAMKNLDPDITFKQVLQTCDRELCIVVTNVDRMTTEYFHPKTTPNVPIRVAVRASMAIPVYFQAFRHDFHGGGQVDTYVDGGVLCNYPISCFDGWWLSMKEEDTFLRRLNKVEELPQMFEKKRRFHGHNDKTLGFMLYAEKEKDLLRNTMEDHRKGTGPAPVPNTKLGNKYREKVKKRKAKEETMRNNRDTLATAIQALFNALIYHDKDKNSSINIDELRNALDHDGFREHKSVLFDQNATAEDVMKELDADSNGVIRFGDLVLYLDQKGFSLSAKFLGYRRNKVTGFFSYLKALQSTLSHNVQRLVVEESDVERTVGINTCYVGTTDFFLEEADKEYLIQQGRRSTEVYLRAYVTKRSQLREEAAMREGHGVASATGLGFEADREITPVEDQGATDDTTSRVSDNNHAEHNDGGKPGDTITPLDDTAKEDSTLNEIVKTSSTATEE